jgi:hypothetical protein
MNLYDVNIRLIKCKATGHVSIFWYYHHGSDYLRQYLGRVSSDGKILLALPEVDLDVLYEIVDKIQAGDVDEDNLNPEYIKLDKQPHMVLPGPDAYRAINVGNPPGFKQ